MTGEKRKWLLLAAMVPLVALALPAEVRSDAAKPVVTAKPAFVQLVVKIHPAEPGPAPEERFRIEANGQCWYHLEGRAARANAPAKSEGNVGHMLPAQRIERINKLLKDTEWLTAAGDEGPATHTDAGTTTLTLDRAGGKVSLECHGRRPEPYAALLHELYSLALQERRICEYTYVRGAEGKAAWAAIGNELDALRGGPFMKSTFNIDYERYLPMAQWIIQNFYTEQDDELIPAVRLVAHFKVKSEVTTLQRMAHDRSSRLRQEVARALVQIHDPQSLPVLLGVMAAGAGSFNTGFELIEWGDAATPEIVKLIALSTEPGLTTHQHVTGENMIRAYLDNWKKIEQPIDPSVIAAVQQALEKVDSASEPRTTYHKEFLAKVAAESARAEPSGTVRDSTP